MKKTSHKSLQTNRVLKIKLKLCKAAPNLALIKIFTKDITPCKSDQIAKHLRPLLPLQ